MNEANFRGAGGTPGGLGEFVVGLIMAVLGGYLLTSHLSVVSGFWSVWGHNGFGLSLVPLIFGIGMLFFNGKSVVGWLLTVAGGIIIFAGILMNLEIYFERTSLFNTLLMILLFVGGIGLILRGLTSHRASQ